MDPPNIIGGIGIACLDHIMVAPRVEPGNTTQIRKYSIQGGGLVATALVACKRLGASVELISLVGHDAVGAQITEGLAAEGIDIQGVVSVPGESPCSFIHVDQASGERTIFHRPAQGLQWPGGDLSRIGCFKALLIDDYYPALARAAAAVAKAHGVPVVADTQPQPDNGDLLRMVDVLIAPHDFLHEGGFADDTDAALNAIRRAGPTTAVVTLGPQGWVASDARGQYRGPAFAVDVVDTLGAGDVFHGAFAFALAQKWSTPRCAEFAAAVAALKCTQLGGRAGIPDLKTTLSFLRDRSRQDWSVTTLAERRD